MVLGKREKLLAVGAGAVVLILVGQGLWSALMSPVRHREDVIANRTQELEKRDRRWRNVRQAQMQMADWNRQALPSDVETARLLYENWLLELTDKAKFRKKKVESAEGRQKKGAYTSLPFTVRGQASLDDLTRFLYEFYSAGYLHQIRRLSVKPLEKSSDFELVVWIEALSLPTSDHEDKLAPRGTAKLAGGDLAAYQKAIVERNVFAPPKPVRPVIVEKKPEAGPPPFDHTKFVFVTGITAREGQALVWLKARTTDEKFMLAEGEQFKIGSNQMKIVRIGLRAVEIEIDGKRGVVPLGEPVQGSIPHL